MENTTKIKVKVTKDVLKKSMMCGTKESDQIGENCAIAIAVRDLLPKAWVSTEWIEGIGMSNKKFIELPEEATAFIYDFDNLKETPEKRLELPEIEFEIEITDDWLEDIDISSILTNHPTMELIEK